MKRYFLTTAAAAAVVLFNGSPGHCINCSVTATPVAFGVYDILSPAPLDSAGGVAVACTNPDKRPVSLRIELSAGSSGSFAQRSMSSSSWPDSLLYNLFLDAGRTTVFGTGAGGSATFSNVTRSTTVNVPIYGRIPAWQNVRPGSYSDTVTATVFW